MFNKVAKGMDTATDARDKRVKPIVAELVKIIGETPVVLTDDSKEVASNYTPATEKILAYLLENKVLFDDINYVFRLILQHSNMIQDFTVQSLNKSMEKAEEKLWGKTSDKVDMADIDEILKN